MNHLQHETSPYLLQHAHNPVDWHAWKPEAFARARAEDKPILVSIGYSTCHWCHVMERESFEREEVAAVMNAHFVCIKVDREERPDVDAIYMEACQMLSQSGGWPLNCFLTPEGKPFYAGTYFPPLPAYGRPSWVQLLEHLADIWKNKRAVAEEQAERILGYIRQSDATLIRKPQAPQADNLALQGQSPALLGGRMYAKLRAQFDTQDGGFGGAPKFPGSMSLQWLLQFHHFSGNREALEHALFSLDKMIQGGIYDQLGGGFSRYATDSAWLVPHFEKMLYDNALLVTVIAEAYKLVNNPQSNDQPLPDNRQRSTLYRETLEETLAYIEREMTHPEGGFYSALDADSEGVEGKFYVWEKAEIEAVLGEAAALFCAFYEVSEEGNWEEKSILWRPLSFEAFAQAHQIDVQLLKAKLKSAREKLFATRARRIRPGLDDKILLGWNALMASAYAAAFTALGHEPYRAAAIRNLDFLLEKFAVEKRSALLPAEAFPPAEPWRAGAKAGHPFTLPLNHTWKNGQAQYDALLDDYAFLIAALTDLYEITFETRYLTLAGKYLEHVFSYCSDPGSPLFFYTGSSQTDIIVRKKDLYDNATPSGNSTLALSLRRLGVLLDRPEWREHAAAMLSVMQPTVADYPTSFGRWASGLLLEEYPIREIAVVGDNALEKAAAIQTRFLPNTVIAASRKPSDEIALLAGKPGEADALMYICRDFACQRPIQTLAEFSASIQAE